MNSPTPAQIKEARKEAGLSTKDFGELIYRSARYVRDRESGESPMDPAHWDLARLRIQEALALTER